MSSVAKTIVHVTTVHPRYDTRIFLKQCVTLAEAHYRVILVVADGLGAERRDGVEIVDIGAVSSRLARMSALPLRALSAVRQFNPDLVHFHDPELIPAGLIMRMLGMQVIYDAHEDLPRAILSKHWLSESVRKPIAFAAEMVEDFAARRFAAVIGATPHIADRFAPFAKRALAVRNFPLAAELDTFQVRSGTENAFCFVGAISRKRGIYEMVEAASMAGARLILAGPFEDRALHDDLNALPEWSSVEYLGVVSREQARDIMARSVAGLLFFHPEPNHINSLPNKMFEYMAGGLPILCSDFEAWTDLVTTAGTGLTCSPLDAQAIAALMRTIMEHPDQAGAMGRRGREAVASAYRWESESARLVELYEGILDA